MPKKHKKKLSSKHHNSKAKAHNKNEINIKINHGSKSKSDVPQYIPFGGGGSTIVNNIPPQIPYNYQDINQNTAYLIMLNNLQREVDNLKLSTPIQENHRAINQAAKDINININNHTQPKIPLQLYNNKGTQMTPIPSPSPSIYDDDKYDDGKYDDPKSESTESESPPQDDMSISRNNPLYSRSDEDFDVTMAGPSTPITRNIPLDTQSQSSLQGYSHINLGNVSEASIASSSSSLPSVKSPPKKEEVKDEAGPSGLKPDPTQLPSGSDQQLVIQRRLSPTKRKKGELTANHTLNETYKPSQLDLLNFQNLSINTAPDEEMRQKLINQFGANLVRQTGDTELNTLINMDRRGRTLQETNKIIVNRMNQNLATANLFTYRQEDQIGGGIFKDIHDSKRWFDHR